MSAQIFLLMPIYYCFTWKPPFTTYKASTHARTGCICVYSDIVCLRAFVDDVLVVNLPPFTTYKASTHARTHASAFGGGWFVCVCKQTRTD